MSKNWWFDKESMAHIHNGILLSGRKRWSHEICYCVDGIGEYHESEVSHERADTEWSISYAGYKETQWRYNKQQRNRNRETGSLVGSLPKGMYEGDCRGNTKTMVQAGGHSGEIPLCMALWLAVL